MSHGNKDWIVPVRERGACIRCKKLTSFYPFGIQFQQRRILHQHHHRLAFSWAQSFLAGATATYYLLPESDAIWCEHISCKFNFYSRKGEQVCLMPLHKPGNTHAKKRKKEKKEEKVMTEEKESVVHSADENVKLLYTCTQKCKAEWHGRGVFSELMQYLVY